ncbi:hypothetical protein LS684_14005 [Cytobacillus spongiae]|uniref:hypothetical protein n=1 Tax=Cytobacillus spongiae TaxID=2901381 RepID=UPI001F2EAF40|nr:hypothetical protein [Cytobacillus spongiae]UII54770.1 hypothetical protein LS684_14005 [Cytobacillus spongiae]
MERIEGMMIVKGKQLTKWGLPGWVFLLGVSSYFISADFKEYKELLIEQGMDLAGIALILAIVGIPLGFFIQQISIFIGWILPKEWRRHFKEEHFVIKCIHVSPQKEELMDRYRNLIFQVQFINAIITSLVFNIGFVLLVSPKPYERLMLVHILVYFILIAIMIANRLFYTNNLSYFIKEIKREGSFY